MKTMDVFFLFGTFMCLSIFLPMIPPRLPVDTQVKNTKVAVLSNRQKVLARWQEIKVGKGKRKMPPKRW